MFKTICCSTVCLATVISLSQATTIQAEEPLVVRLYDVGDLLDQQTDLLGDWLTGQSKATVKGLPVYGGMGDGMGGGMGGMMNVPSHIQPQFGGMGGMGGMFQGVTQPHTSDITAANLIDVITSCCGEANSWEFQTGSDKGWRISLLGNQLVVRTTEKVHQEVDALLTGLRESMQSTPTLEISMRMVMLDEPAAAALRNWKPEAASQMAAQLVKESKQSISVSVRCGNGRQASIASGVRKSFVISVVPVVGAQVGAEVQKRDNKVGYQPTVITPMIGLVGKVRPVLVKPKADSPQSARIDMGMVLSEGGDEVQSITYATGDMIDRLEVKATQMQTQVTLAEDTWALAGLTSLNPGSEIQVAFLVHWHQAN